MCPVEPSCKGGGESRPAEEAEEVDGGVLSQLPHQTSLLGSDGECILRVLAHGQSVLNTVREAQKERKAGQVLARVKVYSKSEKNVPYCIIVLGSIPLLCWRNCP